MGFPDWFLAPLLRPGDRPPGARRLRRLPAGSPSSSFGLAPSGARPLYPSRASSSATSFAGATRR
jgi:hypothetical protein